VHPVAQFSSAFLGTWHHGRLALRGKGTLGQCSPAEPQARLARANELHFPGAMTSRRRARDGSPTPPGFQNLSVRSTCRML